MPWFMGSGGHDDRRPLRPNGHAWHRFRARVLLLLFALGAAATLARLWRVSWRVGRHREAIWKSLVLPAAGSTLCWLLLMTLWLPLLDFGRSYGPISRRIAELVPPQSCVLADGLSQAQIAALRHHGGLRLVRTGQNDPAGADCRSLIATPQSRQPAPASTSRKLGPLALNDSRFWCCTCAWATEPGAPGPAASVRRRVRTRVGGVDGEGGALPHRALHVDAPAAAAPHVTMAAPGPCTCLARAAAR